VTICDVNSPYVCWFLCAVYSRQARVLTTCPTGESTSANHRFTASPARTIHRTAGHRSQDRERTKTKRSAINTRTRFNVPLSGTTQVSRYQKGKPIWILLQQEIVSGSGISWDICKSAPRSRQITTPAPHHSSFFYRPDALPAAQPTASKH